MPERTIYLDMDGVVVDFVGGVCKLFGADQRDLFNRWKPGVYDMSVALGTSERTMFERIDVVAFEFWSNLDPYPWADYLFDELSKLGRVVYLSCPSGPQSAAGKISWIRGKHGSKFRDWVLTPNKGYCAGAHSYLVDDSDEQASNFIVSGGMSVVFPRHWNHRGEIDNTAGITLQEIKDLVRLGVVYYNIR